MPYLVAKYIHLLLGIMEKRLYRYITLPAMGMAWVCGLWMLSLNPYLLSSGWMKAKLFLVCLLTANTFWCGREIRQGVFSMSSRTYRILNEVPTLLMMGILAMVVFRFF